MQEDMFPGTIQVTRRLHEENAVDIKKAKFMYSVGHAFLLVAL